MQLRGITWQKNYEANLLSLTMVQLIGLISVTMKCCYQKSYCELELIFQPCGKHGLISEAFLMPFGLFYSFGQYNESAEFGVGVKITTKNWGLALCWRSKVMWKTPDPRFFHFHHILICLCGRLYVVGSSDFNTPVLQLERRSNCFFAILKCDCLCCRGLSWGKHRGI